MSDIVIDVAALAPWDRHHAIFDSYGRLPVGGALRLDVDHDPVPLRTQFEALHGGEFAWSYLAQGPDAWQVRIEKLRAKDHCCGCCGG